MCTLVLVYTYIFHTFTRLHACTLVVHPLTRLHACTLIVHPLTRLHASTRLNVFTLTHLPIYAFACLKVYTCTRSHVSCVHVHTLSSQLERLHFGTVHFYSFTRLLSTRLHAILFHVVTLIVYPLTRLHVHSCLHVCTFPRLHIYWFTLLHVYSVTRSHFTYHNFTVSGPYSVFQLNAFSFRHSFMRPRLRRSC